MNNMADYLERKFLNLFKGGTITAPTTVYVGLFLSDPGETGTMGLEVSYVGYARALISEWTTPVYDENSKTTTIKNITEVDYAISPTDVGTITHVGIFDALVGGNALFYSELGENTIISADDNPRIVSDEIVIKIQNSLTEAWQAKVLNLLRKTSITAITPYVALFNGATEISGTTTYPRQKTVWGDVISQSNYSETIRNTEKISFPAPDTSLGYVNHIGIFNGESGTDLILYSQYAIEKSIERLTIISFQVDGLSININ